jgi:hypothetical protein
LKKPFELTFNGEEQSNVLLGRQGKKRFGKAAEINLAASTPRARREYHAARHAEDLGKVRLTEQLRTGRETALQRMRSMGLLQQEGLIQGGATGRTRLTQQGLMDRAMLQYGPGSVAEGRLGLDTARFGEAQRQFGITHGLAERAQDLAERRFGEGQRQFGITSAIDRERLGLKREAAEREGMLTERDIADIRGKAFNYASELVNQMLQSNPLSFRNMSDQDIRGFMEDLTSQYLQRVLGASGRRQGTARSALPTGGGGGLPAISPENWRFYDPQYTPRR